MKLCILYIRGICLVAFVSFKSFSFRFRLQDATFIDIYWEKRIALLPTKRIKASHLSSVS